MSDLQALVLGIVQGATEFLPISSTAHIYFADKLLFHGDSGAAFTAIIQWGTLLAALLYFRKDIFAILSGKQGGGDDPGRSLLVPIIVGTIPIVVAGLLFKHKIEHTLRTPVIVAGSMVFFAIILFVAEKKYQSRKDLGDISIKDGLWVGLWQMMALIPGASRSGTTITGALFTGLERSTAARFSFLLSLPAIFGAGAKELLDTVKEMKHPVPGAVGLEARPLVIASVAAFIVGWLSIDWLLKFLKRSPTTGFVVYRVVVGGALLIAAVSGFIK